MVSPILFLRDGAAGRTGAAHRLFSPKGSLTRCDNPLAGPFFVAFIDAAKRRGCVVLIIEQGIAGSEPSTIVLQLGDSNPGEMGGTCSVDHSAADPIS
ncbi:hypothetical protein IEQ34_018458 [Dendrobium chrysotoxum]|uniref:Uncharacterized protein n=1 Tax=Dendrobium chrysotoxum TaxID=161865 RepID=A0AAV7G693_DENCH|nr:hypothetical protein IEQ34_018458 [Dendrobium chrysotoxum]